MLISHLTYAGQEPRQSSEKEASRFRILFTINQVLETRTFSETTTFPLFLEEGTSKRTYETSQGKAFNIGALYAITPGFGIMGGFELFATNQVGSLKIAAPHPLFFQSSRIAETTVPSLNHQEKILYLDAVISIVRPKIVFDLFGGPSLFYIETELLGSGNFNSEYPFDKINIVNTPKQKLKDNPIGFNIGIALTYRITEVVGLVFQARLNKAKANVERNGGDTLDFDVGGFRVGGGIQIQF